MITISPVRVFHPSTHLRRRRRWRNRTSRAGHACGGSSRIRASTHTMRPTGRLRYCRFNNSRRYNAPSSTRTVARPDTSSASRIARTRRMIKTACRIGKSMARSSFINRIRPDSERWACSLPSRSTFKWMGSFRFSVACRAFRS